MGSWFRRLAFVLAAGSTAATAAAQEPELVGLLDGARILSPLGAGRALVCGASCAVFSASDGSFSPQPSAPFDQVSSAARLSDGSVLVYNGSNSVLPQLWPASGGAWRPVAALPAGLLQPRIFTASDGRTVVASRDASKSHTGISVYVADASGWRLLTQVDGDIQGMELEVTTDTLTTLVHRENRLEVKRYDPALDRWHDVANLDGISAERPSSLGTLWGMPLMRTGPGAPSRVRLLRADGEFLELPLPPNTNVQSWPIAAPPGSTLELVRLDGRPYSWRSLKDPPRALSVDLAGAAVAALDDEHLLYADAVGLWFMSLDGSRLPLAPCDGLARYLDMLDVAVRGSSAFDGSYQPSPAVLSAACREQIRGQGESALLTRLRRGAQRPERAPREVARTLLCALNDSASLTDVSRWFEPQDSDAVKLACLRALKAWPGAEAVRARALTNLVRELSGSWSVASALLQYAKEPLSAHLLDELASPLRAAGRHRARGFDHLYRASCTDLSRVSRERAEVCAEFSNSSERAWQAKRTAVHGTSGGTAAALVATALVAGAIGTAYATRESDASRVIASGSGALCGFTVGVGLGGLALLRRGGFSGKGGGNGTGAALLGFGLLAGVGGGFAGYALGRSPGARAPVTAGGLALPYLVTLGIALQ